jgi:putative hemolysin
METQTVDAMIMTATLSRLLVASADYTVRLASTVDEIQAAQRLRYEVFNLELGEGLASSRVAARDIDPFDGACDHLIVEHGASGKIVGTYRVQSGETAARASGYYASQEFDLTPFEGLSAQILEAGRACVERSHRNLVVLGLLWKAISNYCAERDLRYLIGCSSAHTRDPRAAAALYIYLSKEYLAPAELLTLPRPEIACPLSELAAETPSVPKLLEAYISIGARICAPPAIDPEFGTIDFLTFLDLGELPDATRKRFRE